MGRLKESSVFNKIFFMFATILFLGTVSVFAGNIIVNEDGVQASFYSENGSEGLTETFICMDENGANRTLIFENGLLINASGGSENGSNSSFPSSGLISYYKLDNNDLTDSLEVNNGTNSGTTNASGIIIDGRDFELSEGDYVTLPAIQPSSAVSVSAWIKAESEGNRMYVIGGDKSTVSLDGFNLRWNSANTLTIRLGTSSSTYTLTSTPTYSSGTWYHVVSTYDGNNIRLYVNGSELSGDSVSATGTINYGGATSTYIGRRIRADLPDYFDGLIDEIGIWNRALNSTEVSDLYNSGDGLTYP
ncbi:LamG domain-containing protein [Candidatus Pacearchaeota archaeon]|nr:LamG domain-containing protein [Candidatus Pacearchaeota archaeon]